MDSRLYTTALGEVPPWQITGAEVIAPGKVPPWKTTGVITTAGEIEPQLITILTS